MNIDALCLVAGPGKVSMRYIDGILYIYVREFAGQDAEAQQYVIEEGFTRLYLGDTEVIARIVEGQAHQTHKEFEYAVPEEVTN